ncbi:MAG: aminotransferase class I/II-fold pyridoxal phosphate-dependent enzyme [Blastocatellia bacterium]|nr:aminotransferase class I/II-fold pyridoxal phosphate-dependent enzyme [Blastocatellia bacterium]
MSFQHPLESLADLRHEFGEHGGVNLSIEASSTFTVMHASTLPAIFQGKRGPEKGGCYLYGRHYNPTVYVLGKQLAALEGAEAAYCTSSGMSAIASTVLQLANSGDHVVASDTVYGGTFALLKDFLPAKTGIHTTFVDVTRLDEIEAAFTERTKVLFVETMSNPTLKIADLPKLADIAHRHEARLVVDNTFCPLVVSPMAHGADVVIHSLTKFINGTSDIIAGAICGSHEFVESLMDLHLGSLMLLGPTMDPKVASEISLRLPHLGLRMQEHSRRALVFSTRLQEMGVPVIYPGLPEHPHHHLLDALRNPEFGYGGIFCLDMGSSRRANSLLEKLQNHHHFGFMAVSLGYFDTLMTCPAKTTSSELTDEELRRSGIAPGLIRMSIGYTGTIEQRWNQLEESIREVGFHPEPIHEEHTPDVTHSRAHIRVAGKRAS